ncbi:MAG: sugar phosphate nucleotidyltransferase [Gemmatimonadota bacterium]|jgi:mannose-1-phosphate guanylyltransferase/phosphomannomutase
MKGVIMAGGFGTRLKPLTINRPKPMVPVGNLPVMEHILALLRRHGITDLVSILYFQADQIIDYFGDGSRFGVSMEYARTDADYGTAGAVRYAAEQFAGERTLVISGDVLTDFDLGAALAEHERHDAEATIVLTSVANPLAFGIVIVDRETSRIERFLEKPTWGEVFSDTINTGIYVLEPAALHRVPLGEERDFSRHLFPAMLQDGAALFGHVAEGYWRDIGNLDEYRQANEDILRDRVRVELDGVERRLGEGRVVLSGDAVLAEGVEVRGTVLLGRGVRIERGAYLENVIVGAGSVVGEDAHLRDTVLWEDCRVGAGSRLSEAVCARGVHVDKRASVREHSVLADRTEVGEGAVVSQSVKVWPDKVVDEYAVLSHSLIWGEAWERSLFHGSRVSGVPNTELTPEMAVRLGAAFGASLGPGQTVATSRDSDRASRMISRALITGMMSVGVDVEDLRVLPIPVVRHAVHHRREMGGTHVRRSPFDARVVDVLLIDGTGRDLPPGKTQTIERLFSREDFPRAGPDGTGAVHFPTRVVEAYREHFLSQVDHQVIAERRYRLVVDYAYGTTVEVFPSILGALGAEAVSLDAYTAPGRLSRTETEFRDALDRLAGIVRSIEADLGVWLDPGGEVIELVDGSGRHVPPRTAQAVVVDLAVRELGVRRVALPVTSSDRVAGLVEAAGGEVVWTKTDHFAMMASASDAELVAGVRGEFIFPRFQGAYDGMFAVTKVLETLARADRSLTELVAGYKPIYAAEARVACPWSRKGVVMRRLMEATEDLRRELVDGVKVRWDDGWVLVIPHANKAYFVITAEADTAERADARVADYTRMVEEWRDE